MNQTRIAFLLNILPALVFCVQRPTKTVTNKDRAHELVVRTAASHDRAHAHAARARGKKLQKSKLIGSLGERGRKEEPSKIICQATSTAGTVDDFECGATGADAYAATIGCPASNSSASSSSRLLGTKHTNRTYVFLLGFPYSGTSAVHFLLATSPSVSTLQDPRMLQPKKEGWAQRFGAHAGKFSRTSFKRWFKKHHMKAYGSHRMSEDDIPWARLDKLYHSKWNLSKPILLENSPPEIYHAKKLYEEFSPHGEVRFITLARSPCNIHQDVNTDGELHKLKYIQQLVRTFGRQVFVLRYEDVCTNTNRLASALEAWLPGLGQIHTSAVPIQLQLPHPAHGHVLMPVPEYCKQHALPAWPYSTKGFTAFTRRNANELLHFFGYSVRS